MRDAITTTWTPWLTDTAGTETQFTGSPGHSYYFQVRATDQVNNTGAWQQAGPVAIRSVTKYYTFGSQRVAMRQGDEVYYLHGDHLGSTSLTTDGSGAVVAQSRYLPYGQERWSDGAAPTDFGFTGQRHEAGFGLMDYQARYYAPVLGRFVSPDTVVPNPTKSHGLNRYSYANNNPIRYNDPSGHCTPQEGQLSCEEFIRAQGVTIRGTTTVQRPTVQPEIDLYNRSSNAALWPLAIAGQTTKIVGGGFMYKPTQVTPRSITPMQLLPNNALVEVNTGWAKTATGLSYGLPAAGGVLNAMEINYRSQAGEISAEQARQQQIGNAGFTAGAMLGGGAVIPAAAAATSAPVTAGVVGGLSLAYDLSVAQGTFNNYVEGQTLSGAFVNSRAETNRSFGIGGFDSTAYEILSPALTPVFIPIAKTVYNIP